MAEQKIGTIVNGATGRMTRNQHLKNSLIAIRDKGGVALPDGSRIVPDGGKEIRVFSDSSG